MSELSNEELRKQIQMARKKETKAKAGVYTLRGLKSLDALQADYMEQQEEEKSAHEQALIDLRKQLEDMKRQQEEELAKIEELKKKKLEIQQKTQANNNNNNNNNNEPPQVIQQPPMVVPNVVPQEQAPMVVPNVQAPMVVPNNVAPNPPVQVQKEPEPEPEPVKAPQNIAPSPPSNNNNNNNNNNDNNNKSTAVKKPRKAARRVTKGKNKGKPLLDAPESTEFKVTQVGWEGSKARSKNKYYKIDVNYDGSRWKIVRGDEQLTELQKKLHKLGADGTPFCPLVKKAIKEPSKNDLKQGVESWLNGIKPEPLFKKDKNKLPLLNFLAPFGPKDEGIGDWKGNQKDVENWFCYKLMIE